jgi:Tol biopolymer transport system component/tRNA A-37 threonylcarbamoyl transferase component Bud32
MHTTDQLNVALEGRYVIERHIGEGGMAAVYLARDIRHRRRVALKVLKPDLGAVVGSERFLSEIQVTANLQHPNLLPLFDSGAVDNLLFYVMPYVEGESLRARLQREKQLPVDEAVRLASAIAGALHYAHRHGVIHRDLKPENILLHEDQPLVADFGIALALSNAGGSRITQTGLSLGTPQYMSPEQATGDRTIDGRTDIYSLGAVMYEMLTGEPPHTGPTSQAVIARVITDQPRPIRASRPNVPEHVEAAVAQALEKLPADRFATAKELGEALTGARVVTRTTAVASQARHRSNALLFIVSGVAVAALAGVAVLATRRPPAPPRLPLAQFDLSLPDSLRLGLGGGGTFLQISQDGSTIVIGGREGAQGTTGLYIRRLDDLSLQRIRGTDSARSPVLSPDGSEIIFGTSNASGTAPMLKRVPTGGGTARTVVSDVSPQGQVSWIDANRIVFTRPDGLWMMSVDGGTPTRLAVPDTSRRHRRYGYPDVLPGGSAALITVWRGRVGIDSAFVGIMSIPGGQVTELGIRGAYPRYSGTGHILYASTEGMLFAVPFDAGTLRVNGEPFMILDGIRAATSGAATYAVARNGTLVYVPGEVQAGGMPIQIVDRSGNSRQILPQRGFFSYPRVSPDGRRIALTMGSQPTSPPTNPDIWIADTASKGMMRLTTDSVSARATWLGNDRIAYTRGPPDSAVRVRQLFAQGEPGLVRTPAMVGDFAAASPHGYAAFRTAPLDAARDIWLVHMDSLDRPRPFLTAPYAEHSPAFSPGGKFIAYVTDKTGRTEVYVQPVTGGAEVQVSVNGGIEPVWSKDNTELFYRSPTHVMTATITEGSPLTVTRRDSLFRDRGSFVRSSLISNYDVFPGSQYFVLFGVPQLTAPAEQVIVRMNWHVRDGVAPRNP